MSLSQDAARCNSYAPFGVTHTACRDCQRRTETVHGERQSWIAGPICKDTCASRIAPEGEKND